tara:strand:- start:674 stop:889 length:216 start_codon:yes stop_codon:yes gene_type:complete
VESDSITLMKYMLREWVQVDPRVNDNFIVPELKKRLNGAIGVGSNGQVGADANSSGFLTRLERAIVTELRS